MGDVGIFDYEVRMYVCPESGCMSLIFINKSI